MRTRELPAFAATPFITPERLQDDCAGALAAVPRWADAWALASDEDATADEGMLVLGIRSARRSGSSTKESDRDENGGQWYVPATFGAILCELTRYKNSVVSNTNKKAKADNALFYLKVTFSSAGKDNTPAARLIVNAGADEEVQRTLGDELTPHSERYLHPRFLQRVGAGKPEKPTRSVAIAHAARCAKEVGKSFDEVRAYVANLEALFDSHDTLYGVERWDC